MIACRDMGAVTGPSDTAGMDDETIRVEGPATVVECPWCERPAEVARDATSIECAACSLVVALAADEPAMATAA